ncbi:NAD(P)H-hydrate dehydratase [Candidatus Woesearchaeota archaeon]|nr:NAD(P)H-hydrate dehydratase [Candidatus Woesearchaeota archaeon]
MKYITKKDIKLPKRNSKNHKGDNGKVLVIGGSEDYAGAVALAGLAALRSGVDWVTVAAPEKVGWAVNALSSDLVVKKYKCSYFSLKYSGEIRRLSDDFDAFLVGNGIGVNIQTKNFVKKIVENNKKSKVVDADGIKSLSMDIVENSIITPHNQELETFLLNSKINRLIIKKIIKEKSIIKKSLLIKNNLKKFLGKNNVILLKGKIDVVISKDKIKYNKTGNAGMTKAGTGDVLAGLCVGFLGQGLSLIQSAINAAYFNGLIGDILLKKKKGFTYLASDMVEEIKRILN